jgi:hypothetical protein
MRHGGRSVRGRHPGNGAGHGLAGRAPVGGAARRLRGDGGVGVRHPPLRDARFSARSAGADRRVPGVCRSRGPPLRARVAWTTTRERRRGNDDAGTTTLGETRGRCDRGREETTRWNSGLLQKMLFLTQICDPSPGTASDEDAPPRNADRDVINRCDTNLPPLLFVIDKEDFKTGSSSRQHHLSSHPSSAISIPVCLPPAIRCTSTPSPTRIAETDTE